jgi:hypothetical protein
MNKGMLYILENELVQHVVMVHVHSPSAAAIDMSLFHRNLAMVNSEYPGVTMSAFAVSNRSIAFPSLMTWCQ